VTGDGHHAASASWHRFSEEAEKGNRGNDGGFGRSSSRAGSGAAQRSPNRGSSGSASLRQVSWAPEGELTLKDWIIAGRKLGLLGRGAQWWLGDWIRFGNARWGDRYKEASRITGYEPGSLRNMAWVSGQFDPPQRDPRLSWSHYPMLAKLQPEEREVWIERAVEDRLTVGDLRAELRRSQGESDLASGEDELEVVSDPMAIPRSVSGGERLKCPHCGEWITPDDQGEARAFEASH
jgi:hypothetical protein